MRNAADFLCVPDGQYVMIAFHLRKKCFSIREMKTRKVIGYTERIVLRDVLFSVSSAGRLRVLRDRNKNVHAFVMGHYEEDLQTNRTRALREAYYNPYQVETFVDRESGEPLTTAAVVICEHGKVYYQLNQ